MDSFALISALCATEALNGMDLFFRAATKSIYICLVSFSWTPHVTSCRVEPLIAAPSWCCWLVAAFRFTPLRPSPPPTVFSIQHRYHSIPLSSSAFFFSTIKGKNGGGSITLCFAPSKSNFFCTAVNSSPLHDALWLPPRCILSQDRIDALFHCKEARA